MGLKARWQHWRRTRVGRWTLFLIGCVLLVATPFIGVLPGPGGIFVFAAGATLLLQTSFAAKRVFVRIERRWPRIARYANKALRRRRNRSPAPSSDVGKPPRD